MSELTPLDLAHQAMADAPDADTPRLRFFERLLDAELYLVLEEEPEADQIKPVLLALEEGQFVLVFDREERMAAFMDGITPYAALAGRRIIEMLAGQEIGLALNLGGYASETMLPAGAVDWAAGLMEDLTSTAEEKITEVTRPAALPESLLSALDAKLAVLSGMASGAWLGGVVYESGAKGHLLGLVGVPAPARDRIAEAIGESLRLSGLEAGQLDVGFFDPGHPVLEGLEKVGLGFDIPEPVDPTTQMVSIGAPGMDPAKPPKLR